MVISYKHEKEFLKNNTEGMSGFYTTPFSEPGENGYATGQPSIFRIRNIGFWVDTSCFGTWTLTPRDAVLLDPRLGPQTVKKGAATSHSRSAVGAGLVRCNS